MWWVAEGVDEGKGAGRRKSTGAEGFLPTQLTCLLWLQQGAERIRHYELSHNDCSITGLSERHASTYHLSWLSDSTTRRPCLSRNQVKSEGMFSRHKLALKSP